jgi:hypothetical protein
MHGETVKKKILFFIWVQDKSAKRCRVTVVGGGGVSASPILYLNPRPSAWYKCEYMN